jgi:hypothetical protein
METFKFIFKAAFWFCVFIMLMVGVAQCERENSPMVDGEKIGAGYECHDGVLYVVSHGGAGRGIAAAYSAETGKIRTCR